jgi:hypothetical protein
MDKYSIYKERKANSTLIWLLFLFLGWSYGSLGKIGLQILYYITIGGFGIWTLVRLFTLQGAIRAYNRKVALQSGFNNDDLLAIGLI